MLSYIEKTTVKLCASEQRTDHCEKVKINKLIQEVVRVAFELCQINNFVDNRDQEFVWNLLTT